MKAVQLELPFKDLPPFGIDDIEDVRIIIKAGGKHWSIIPKKSFRTGVAKNARIVTGIMLLDMHEIVVPNLEEIKKK